MALLRIENLDCVYHTRQGDLRAVEDMSFEIENGRNFGLVGESGCGKSTLLKAVMRVLPPNARIDRGRIFLEKVEVTGLDPDKIRRLRWKKIAMITQSAMNALDPVYTVGEQIVEAIQVHENVSRKQARERVEKLFDLVGIEKKRFSEFPHQFSGGMRQRAIIAMSLILNPILVIADEPTTSLDVIVQDQIFKNIRRLQEEIGFSLFLVTHDIALVIENCDDIGVMYGGKLMELGPLKAVIKTPFHPYTMGLKNSFPNIHNRHSDPISIPGVPPSLSGELRGCRFSSRCPFATRVCWDEAPSMLEVGPHHKAACHHVQHALNLREKAGRAAIWLKQESN